MLETIFFNVSMFVDANPKLDGIDSTNRNWSLHPILKRRNCYGK
jgi:hypothetical protein